MTKTAALDHAIAQTLAATGQPLTEREIEAAAEVLQAARRAKIKARSRIRLLASMGRIQWDQAHQRPRFWV
jgi:DNA-binding MurR/RpiR family transcriptional regulator